MGRRAKYLTKFEKQEASRKSKEAYRQSERAKILRVEQNRRAYSHRQDARKVAQAVKLEVPAIPSRMRQLAVRHVPLTSPPYKRGYESNSPIEEDEDYAQFLHPPPYTISEDLKEAGWARISLIVQGKREKALKNLEIKRMVEQYNRQDRRTFCETLHGEILRHLDGWQGLCATMDKARSRYCCEWVSVMGRQVLQWQARLVMHMVEDLEAASCEEEDEKYIRVFLERWDRR